MSLDFPFVQVSFLANCLVSSTALLVWDYILTFDQEVEHIWRGSFSGAKLLYFLNRYAYLGEVFFDILLTLGPQHLVGCRLLNVCLGATKFTANICTALISAFRVWAIWGQRWHFFIIVLPIALVVPCFNVANFATARTHMLATDLPPPYGGCVWMSLLSMETTKQLQMITRISAMITDLIVVCATWLKTYMIRRKMKFSKNKAKTPLITLLYRDGTVYFGSLLLLNVLALVAEYIVEQLENPIPYFIDVLTAILISRFMLRLRSFKVISDPSSSSHHKDPSHYHSTSTSSTSTTPSAGVLSTIIGNFGAPLSMGSVDFRSGSEYWGRGSDRHGEERYREEDGGYGGDGGEGGYGGEGERVDGEGEEEGDVEVTIEEMQHDPLAAGLYLEERYDPNYLDIDVMDADAEFTPLVFARV